MMAPLLSAERFQKYLQRDEWDWQSRSLFQKLFFLGKLARELWASEKNELRASAIDEFLGKFRTEEILGKAVGVVISLQEAVAAHNHFNSTNKSRLPCDLALPAPDGPHNQIESKPTIEGEAAPNDGAIDASKR
jgi:hypothetical protein